MNAVSQALTIDNDTSEPTPRKQVAALAAMTPMDMLNHAVSNGAGIDVLEKLMGLQERYEASQARKAFDTAIAKAKAEIPVISKNRKGHNDKRYADFAAFASVVDPIIGRYGISYRFRTTQNDKINVTCILSHEAGHYEETTLSGPADVTGNKNAIQAIGSTLTYLQRYSLTQALGLAASEDDDGKAAADDGGLITVDQVNALREIIEERGGDIAAFCKVGGVEALAEISVKNYDAAVRVAKQKPVTK